MAKPKSKHRKTTKRKHLREINRKRAIRTMEELLSVATPVRDALRLSLEDLDFESRAGVVTTLAQMQNMRSILEEISEQLRRSAQKDADTETESRRAAVYRALEHDDSGSAFIVNTGQTRKPASHRGQ